MRFFDLYTTIIPHTHDSYWNHHDWKTTITGTTEQSEKYVFYAKSEETIQSI